MKVDVVVDIGNSRIKWGRCEAKVTEVVALSPDRPDEWQRQLDVWQLKGPLGWAVASVNPSTAALFTRWAAERGDRVCALGGPGKLPLRVLVESPDRVGIDRLLNAVAANRLREGRPAVIVDAGSAVTVDLVDETGAFRGGAIFPGLRLMARALHDHTALLPVVEVRQRPASVLGTSTVTAIESGVYYAVSAAIKMLASSMGVVHTHLTGRVSPSSFFLTGGDAPLLPLKVGHAHFIHWPEMTLEGIRLSAEALP